VTAEDRPAAAAEGIRFAREGALGVVTLDRQSALNALTREMVQALSLQLVAWRSDPEIAAVLVKAAPGRAFCAGGDIRSVYEAGRDGRTAEALAFFRDEYRLNWRIFRFPKPYVALLDGIVMGGGVGISVHGSHRVVTEDTLFAMPETGIGFFPDVGGSYFLPRCSGELGTYLGLTGERLHAADCLYAGIATRQVPADSLSALEDTLSSLPAGAGSADVDVILDRFAAAPAEVAAPPLAAARAMIDRCFAGESVPAIAARLRAEGEVGARILGVLATKSPLSLHVTLAQLRRGAALTFEEAMRFELRLAARFMASEEFFEGVRALLVDKDKRPRWRHADLDSVPAAEVEELFRSPEGLDELEFDWAGV
jgi:enoyl-CoA hydratase